MLVELNGKNVLCYRLIYWMRGKVRSIYLCRNICLFNEKVNALFADLANFAHFCAKSGLKAVAPDLASEINCCSKKNV